MDRYSYHLGIYSKLIRGRTPDGPVKPGVEAKIVAATPDFPDKFQRLCTTSLFFPQDPPVTLIDARLMAGGTFVYMPVFLDRTHLGVFARIEARPERGTGQGGRRFTHCAALVVRNRWEPALIRWAARMLFTDSCGGRCWGEPVFEHQSDRFALAPPDLMRSDLPSGPRAVRRDDLPALGDLTRLSQVRLPTPSMTADREACPGQVDVADWLAEQMAGGGYNVQGRFLAFCCGASMDIGKAAGSGFFIGLDSRNSIEIARNEPLGFHDARPARIAPSNFPQPVPPWRQLSHGGGATPNMPGNTLDEANFWDDQRACGLAEAPGRTAARPPEPEAQPDAPEAQGFDFETDPDLRARPDSAPLRPSGYPWGDALTPDPAEAPFHDGAGDPIAWPLQAFCDDIPPSEPLPASREKLQAIHRALRQLEARLRVIDAPPYDRFPQDDAILERICDAHVALVELIVCFAGCGGNVTDLRGELEQLFRHDAIPALGVAAGGMDGLLADIFRKLVFEIGPERLVADVDGVARMERAAVRKQNFEYGTGIHLDAPNKAAFWAFFDWLGGGELALADKDRFDRTEQIWWDDHLKMLVSPDWLPARIAQSRYMRSPVPADPRHAPRRGWSLR